MKKKFPDIGKFYDEFLKSKRFKELINIIKSKNDEEYLKLFFRHAKNYLNIHIKEKEKETNLCKENNEENITSIKNMNDSEFRKLLQEKINEKK